MDEAYAEFTGETVIPLRTRYPNLVVVRTASKAYALAGLRVGFAIAAPGHARADRALPAAGLHRHDLRDGGDPRAASTARRCARTCRASTGSARAWPRRSRLRAGVPYPSVTNFILRRPRHARTGPRPRPSA